jgi:hypothetical protein
MPGGALKGCGKADVVLNILGREKDESIIPLPTAAPHLQLKEEPIADCSRYERLLKEAGYAVK